MPTVGTEIDAADLELIKCDASKLKRAWDYHCSCDRLTGCGTAQNSRQAKIKLKFPSMIF